jgi:hypothetical protein
VRHADHEVDTEDNVSVQILELILKNLLKNRLLLHLTLLQKARVVATQRGQKAVVVVTRKQHHQQQKVSSLNLLILTGLMTQR